MARGHDGPVDSPMPLARQPAPVMAVMARGLKRAIGGAPAIGGLAAADRLSGSGSGRPPSGLPDVASRSSPAATLTSFADIGRAGHLRLRADGVSAGDLDEG